MGGRRVGEGRRCGHLQKAATLPQRLGRGFARDATTSRCCISVYIRKPRYLVVSSILPVSRSGEGERRSAGGGRAGKAGSSRRLRRPVRRRGADSGPRVRRRRPPSRGQRARGLRLRATPAGRCVPAPSSPRCAAAARAAAWPAAGAAARRDGGHSRGRQHVRARAADTARRPAAGDPAEGGGQACSSLRWLQPNRRIMFVCSFPLDAAGTWNAPTLRGREQHTCPGLSPDLSFLLFRRRCASSRSAALMQRLHQAAADRARLEAESAKAREDAKALEEDIDRQARLKYPAPHAKPT